MQGFAVIDSQPDSSVVVVWHTTRVGATDVEHTNAVALDLDLEQIPHFLNPDYQGAAA